MDIEVRLLRSFVAIYERGSLSRAAEKLACTQAAMSMRLKMLETEIGAPLFIRHHHRIEPTSKGSELYARALRVLAAYDEMISTTRSQRPRAKIRIGMPDDYALGFLSRVMANMRETIADTEFEIVCDLSAKLAAALQRQEIDIALVTLASGPAAARHRIMTRLNWVHRTDFQPDSSGSVALAAYPEGCVFRRTMISALEASQRNWRVAVQSSSQAGILAAVQAGVAVTSMAKGTAPAGLVEITGDDRLPELEAVPLYLLGRQGQSGAAIRQVEDLILAELENAPA
ncbi:MAG: LysR family transcriptional regulator [Mesorhizobium sp.]|uniref:LysR family transcriptional regulator n=1 Tax=Mesorhizobium sp. TaxID=1871066 RepID=UPI001ACB049F|nr:LysR family transcriptional regulator [Mesorhizobium sp.]MBN9222860.1 LysR family transcriptional regulator [Mesorhizobium sp.]